MYHPRASLILLINSQYLTMKTILAVLTILGVLTPIQSQDIDLITATDTIAMAVNGTRDKQFYQYHKQMDCGMPELYIYLDKTHQSYMIHSQASQIQTLTGVWAPIEYNLTCNQNFCDAEINNQCGVDEQQQINWIKVTTSIGELEYLINCNPQKFYKPFEWGLLLLIILTTLVLTLSSLYSRAWSYGGIGYEITNKAIVVFNLSILAIITFGYLYPEVLSLITRIVGSIVGALGVGVCISETIWLTHNKNYLKKIYKKVRLIDIISYGIGLIFIPLYWLLNGQWIVNDIMAVCSTVALMKLLKIKSLSIAVNLLASLLILEIIAGVVIHYVLKLSYNNYIINLFQNPLMLVMPSITNELYRQCAWLPITAALFPGLVLSYLRRFDRTRGTYIYFLIGLGSFYFGSICWMIVDLETVHSLPFAIISEPITILIVLVQSHRRNEFKTLWRGTFHDQQLDQGQKFIPSKETEIIAAPSAYEDLTSNLRVSANSSSNYEAVRISQDFKL